MERKKPGRPAKEPSAGARKSLGLKVTAETKQKIAQAAEATGRTQSQEAEYRLERSFDREDLLPDILKLAFGEFGLMLLLLAHKMQISGRFAAAKETLEVECWQGDRW